MLVSAAQLDDLIGIFRDAAPSNDHERPASVFEGVDASAWVEAPRGSPDGVKVRAELLGVAVTIDWAQALT